MQSTFKLYDPQQRPTQRACEACYIRKVRCDQREGDDSCRQCREDGAECRARSKKRKIVRGTPDHRVATRRRIGEIRQAPNNASSAVTGWRPSDQAVQPHPGPVNRGSTTEIQVPIFFMSKSHKDGVSPAAPSRSQRSPHGSFLSRAATLGDDFAGIDHSHGDQPLDSGVLPADEVALLASQGAFDLPELPARVSYYEAFVERCYPWMPVLDLELIDVAHKAPGNSILALQAVLLVGAIMRSDVCDITTLSSMYKRVKLLILSGLEQDTLKTLGALCLIQWHTPTAPKDVSTDSPRFWNTYAIGLAHQLGLHRQNPTSNDRIGLRKRIWYTLCARDCMTSAAHGRPRLITSSDSDLVSLNAADFSAQDKLASSLFPPYCSAAAVLGDACQHFARKGKISMNERAELSGKLTTILDGLPEQMRLFLPSGQSHPYDCHLAQLHIYLLTSIIILHRPRSVFTLDKSNLASVAAALVACRLFEAMNLRADIRCLPSAFAWLLLVAAMPLLSCTRVASLKKPCGSGLDVLERCLSTLAKLRPAAATNLKSVRTIRNAVSARTLQTPFSHRSADDCGRESHNVILLLAHYGAETLALLESLGDVFERQATVTGQTESALERARISERTADRTGHQVPIEPGAAAEDHPDDWLQGAFTDLFQDETLVDPDSWMLRDWIDTAATGPST